MSRVPLPGEEYERVRIVTDRGGIEARYYGTINPRRGVICVGDKEGGWDAPCKGSLYPSVGKDLKKKRIASLRIQYRYPDNFVESILDVMAGIEFLKREGVWSIGLIGHSFGGAVALQAAAHSEIVATVIALSTQSYGAEAVLNTPIGMPILFMHGTDDEVSPMASSEYAYMLAREPKELKLLPGASHKFDESVDDVRQTVVAWFHQKLVRNE